jgi:cell division protein FtsL
LWRKKNKQKGKPIDKPIERLSRSNRRVLVVIILIIVVALISFILLYQYSNSISGEIVNLAIDDIKSNAKIQSHVISHSLANSVSAIISNLRVLTMLPQYKMVV